MIVSILHKDLEMKIANDDDVEMEGEEKIKRLYDDFFERRQQIKTNLYSRIVRIGLLTFIFGLIVIAPAMIFVLIVPGQAVLGGILSNSGIFIISVGICIFCSVPTDEFDIDKIENSPSGAVTLSTFLGLFMTVLGCGDLLMPPYVPGFFLILCGLTILFHKYILPKVKLSTKVYTAGLLTYIPLWCAYYIISFDMIWFSKNCLYLRPFQLDFFEYINEFQPTISIIFFIGASQFLIGNLLALYFYSKLSEKKNSGWETSVIYRIINCWMISTGLQGFTFGIANTFVDMFEIPSIFLIGQGIILLIPPLILLILGPKRCFLYLVRKFEYNIKRLQEDGAFMAKLAKSCTVLDKKTKIRWIHRQCKSDDINTAYGKNFITSDNLINRNNWIKGTIVGFPTKENSYFLKLAISYTHDLDYSWQYIFIGDDMTNINKPDKLVFKPTVSSGDWLRLNFNNTTDQLTENTYIMSSKMIPPVFDENSMLIWAIDNLKQFRWKNFNDILLFQSPRELSSNELREKTFQLSEYVKVNKESDKIDFFISHSWSAEPEKKCIALKKFVNNYIKENKREPTFWFDKVCIDQKDPGNHLEVLPINIGSCKKMLILMDLTYITRIWCIWEIFTLLTFCNKELALNRIEIVVVPKEGDTYDYTFRTLTDLMLNFDFDIAHCYDPNEEFKLRKIINNVGKERLIECMKSLANLLLVLKKN